MPRLFPVISAFVLITFFGTANVVGQGVSSKISVGCTVEPGPSFGFLATGDGTGASLVTWSRRFVPEGSLPPGTPADAGTVAAIDAIVQEWAACLNAGQFARSAAFMTSELAWPLHEQLGLPRDEMRRLLNAPLSALPDDRQVSIGPASSARVLADGRLGAVFDVTQGNLADVFFMTFSAVDGHWRFDGVLDMVSIPSSATIASYRVVAEFPHDPGAFTQGLTFMDDRLYEGTGHYGESTLRRVDLDSGVVLQAVALDERHFGEGIAVLEDRIYQITWRTQTCFVYDRDTFEQVATFGYDTEGWGLTTDGDRLIMSDGTSRIVFRDPASFEELGQIEVHDGESRITGLNELEYIDGEIWANVYTTDFVARIDPETGRVVGWIDLTGLLTEEDRAAYDVDVLNGIAHDGQDGRIFVTGKWWPKLFEIEVIPPA